MARSDRTENELDLLIGEVLASRYRLEERLGDGATGSVYRARHVKVGRAFAVKILHHRHTKDERLLRRFELEAELGGRLRHPNVLSVVDVGETTDGGRFMVMELAHGVPLAAVLSGEAPLASSRIIPMVRQILDGLHHAHERGVIHRDLKPENILVERDDHGREVPRIVDFGIAIARDEASAPDSPERLTTGGIVLGTPHYMAPEQATGSAMDHRIDLFALGVIMFEMVTGEMPFDGSGVDVARANLLEPTPVMGVRVPHLMIDPLLEAFTARLMSKSAELRPASAKAARELLDRIEKDRAAAAKELQIDTTAATLGELAAELGVDWTPGTGPSSSSSSGRVGHVRGPARPTTPSGLLPMEMDSPTAPAPVSSPSELATPTSTPIIAPARLPRASTAPPPGIMTAEVAREDREIGERRAKRPLVIGLVAVATLALAGVVWLAVGAGGDPDKPAQPIAATEPALTQPAQPAPSPVTAQPASPTPPAPPPAQPSPEQPAAAVPVAPPHPQPPAAPVGNAISERPRQLPTPQPPPSAQQPPATQQPPPQRSPHDTSAAAVAQLYGTVGRELKALAEQHGTSASADLWPRYRRIRINEVLSSPSERATAADELTELLTEIAARRSAKP
nr:serine/threonine-protein kinase [Kofleriaceae bacterium]